MPRSARAAGAALLSRAVLAAFAAALIAVVATVVVDVVNAEPDTGPPPLLVRAGAAPGGTGTAARPFAGIQAALEVARPGQTVQVGPGTYREALHTVRPGRRGAPIRLVGDGAAITGDGDDVNHLIEVAHDHVQISGFDISGASTLIVLTRVRQAAITRNTLHDAGGECIRLRYFSARNEIGHNTIRDCGREGFDLGADDKNGEGVYIGTAPEQLDRNPTDAPDRSDFNRVHDNHITTPAECVDVKEDAYANLVTDNVCRGSRDPKGGGLSSRGIRTTFRRNDSGGNAGAGIRLGGDDPDDGVRSVVTGNHLHGNGHAGVKVVRRPQGLICGNRVEGNADGPTNTDDIDPERSCRPGR